MAYVRCECKGGDIPHEGAAVHKRVHGRCSRAATHEVRKRYAVETGNPNVGHWYGYCDACTAAIVAYQESSVVVRELAGVR